MDNNYTELFTSGCSFLERSYDFERESKRKNKLSKVTVQESLDEKYSFPSFLSTKLNLPLINRAKAGHSNRYIIRSTGEYLMKKDPSQPSLAVIALTELTRTEIPVLNTDKYHPISATDYHFFRPSYRDKISDYVTPSKLKSVLNDYYKYLYNDATEINHLVQQLNMLSGLARITNTRLIVFSSFLYKNDPILKGIISKKLLVHGNKFEFFNFGYDKSIIKTWVDFIHSYEPLHTGGHPYAYDCNILANMMVKQIKDNKINPIPIKPTQYTSGFDYKNPKVKDPVHKKPRIL
tara:strand:- start:3465 stop:4340 length:876 start_codon:yes stop_codon:yes gene_type:complete